LQDNSKLKISLHKKAGEKINTVLSRVVDPDSETLWIRIRFGNPDPGARKLRNFRRKNALFSYLKKKIPLKRYNYFLKKNLMNNTSIFDLI
jgi:hypothetical protein